jgi:hypothetical protein
VGLGWLVNAYPSHSIHRGGGQFEPTKPGGSVMSSKGVGCWWDRGGGHVGF